MLVDPARLVGWPKIVEVGSLGPDDTAELDDPAAELVPEVEPDNPTDIEDSRAEPFASVEEEDSAGLEEATSLVTDPGREVDGPLVGSDGTTGVVLDDGYSCGADRLEFRNT